MSKDSMASALTSTPSLKVQQERRTNRRNTVTPRQPLPVVIRCGQGEVYRGRVLNISSTGILVEFPKDQLPPASVDSKVSVKLQYLGDCIWLPGIVRHRKGNKMGFFFPELTSHPAQGDQNPLSVVLHSLSRAVSSS